MFKIICDKETFSELVNVCYGSTNCDDCVLSCVCNENPQDLVGLCSITKTSDWQQELGEFLKEWKQKHKTTTRKEV